MKSFVKWLVLAAVVFGVALFFWPAAPVQKSEAPTPEETPAAVASAPTAAQLPNASRSAPQSLSTASASLPALGAVEPPDETEKWNETVNELLLSDRPESEKAAVLLATLPTLVNPTNQIDAAEHIVNLLADEEFATATPYLTNYALPQDLVAIFFNDLHLRPDEVKGPLFLEVARLSEHPFAGEALEALEAFVGEDYQTNWPAWTKAIEAKLREP